MTRDSITIIMLFIHTINVTIIMLYSYNQRYVKEIKNKIDDIIPAARQLKERKFSNN